MTSSYASSVGTIAVITALLVAQSAHANSIADKPNAHRASVTVNVDQYDCTKTGMHSAHIGQVIDGTYREWVQNTLPGSETVTCVTQIRPTAGQLTKADAATLLRASRNLHVSFVAVDDGKAKPAATAEDGTIPMQVSALPAGIAPSAKYTTADAPEGAATKAEVTGGGDRTLPQQLSPAGNERYAVLDVGYGSTPVAPAAAPDTGKKKPATIGQDDRLHVGDTTEFPWQLIGQLVVTWKDGTQSVCTGTLVSAHVVLSAGQCAHNRDRGGFAAKASFAPAQSQLTPTSALKRPSGIRYADYVETNNRWTQISGGQTVQILDARSDYAAFYFSQPWTVLSTFMPVVYGDTAAGIVNSAGYPTDAPGAQGLNQDMILSLGLETQRSANLLRAFQVREYAMDVSAGQNGAPIWTFDGETRKITGVVSYGGDEVAGGVWFGGENQSIVSAFVSWTPAQSGPSHLADNLRVPLAIPSGDLSSDSYVRLYNPTPQSGTVAITFNDGGNGQTLGTWTSPPLPPFSSLQFYIKEMEPAANITAGAHERYTLRMSATFPGFFQHVLWNRAGISLTNTSGCGNGLSNDVIHVNNVHSSLFVDYPSVVFAHNVGTKAANAVIAIYDAATGGRLGAVVIPNIPANATAAFRMNEVEAVLGFRPVPGQFHYNLVQEGDFPGYLQHLVYNTRAGLITNMTSKCAFPLR